MSENVEIKRYKFDWETNRLIFRAIQLIDKKLYEGDLK